MRFLIDEDCPRSIKSVLQQIEYEALDIRDIQPGASDDEIYKYIQKEVLILITRDTDFGNILRYPVTQRCGIILLRTYLLSIREICGILNDFISNTTQEALMGSLSVLRKGRYRIHKFQLWHTNFISNL